MKTEFRLVRTKDTKNYAKFEAPAPTDGPRAFGTVYLPLAQAVGVAEVLVVVDHDRVAQAA